MGRKPVPVCKLENGRRTSAATTTSHRLAGVAPHGFRTRPAPRPIASPMAKACNPPALSKVWFRKQFNVHITGLNLSVS